MPPKPTGVVLSWLDQQPADSIWITSITYFEVLFGIALLPAGRKRNELLQAFERLMTEALEDRIVDFDRQAVAAAGQLAARRRGSGQSVDMRDIQIAGIFASRRATLATRNTRHFSGSGIKLVNPWE